MNLSKQWQAAKRKVQDNFVLSFPFLGSNVMYVEQKCVIYFFLKDQADKSFVSPHAIRNKYSLLRAM